VLGLNTAGLHRSGITVPSATVTRVVAELLEKGSVTRPYLGLSMQAAPLPESLRSKLNLMASEGLVVLYVEPEGPADKAGVLLGDVLFEVDSKSVSDTDGVQDVLGGAHAGKVLTAKFIRAGSVVAVDIEPGSRK
jgi:S1-C subfamily serine protease